MKIKLHLLIFILALLAQVTVFGKGLVVTDVDDTIRATNTRTVVNQLTRIFRSSNDFSGAASFLQAVIGKGRFEKAFYVSAGPSAFRKSYDQFLAQSKFPVGQLTLKSGNLSSFEYKLQSITNIIKAQQPDEVLLLGDNSQYDSWVYDQLAERFPNIKFTTLIHQVYSGGKAAKILPNQIPFLTFGVAAAIGLEKGFIDQASFDHIVTEMIADAQSADPHVRRRVIDSYFEVQDYFAKNQWPQMEGLTQLGQLVSQMTKVPLVLRCEGALSSQESL